MRSCLAALGLVALVGLPATVSAQTRQSQPTEAQLSRQFRDGFLKGCRTGKTPGVKNQRGYCDCMVSGYQGRYDGQTLAAMSQLAGSLGEKGPALVNLMMQPEAKKCVARY